MGNTTVRRIKKVSGELENKNDALPMIPCSSWTFKPKSLMCTLMGRCGGTSWPKSHFGSILYCTLNLRKHIACMHSGAIHWLRFKYSKRPRHNCPNTVFLLYVTASLFVSSASCRRRPLPNSFHWVHALCLLFPKTLLIINHAPTPPPSTVTCQSQLNMHSMERQCIITVQVMQKDSSRQRAKRKKHCCRSFLYGKSRSGRMRW